MKLKRREINEKLLKEIKKNLSPHTKIIAVTKTLSSKSIESAFNKKIYLIGESKIQETEIKIKELKEETRKKIKLHFIGNLQTNKIKKAVRIFDVIETIYTLKQLIKVDLEAKKINKKQNFLFQVNIGKDIKKRGVYIKELDFLINECEKYKNIKPIGLMTILPQHINNKQQQQYYEKMKKVLIKIKKTHPQYTNLSMGMSGDYITASRQGATHVRIGTLLYGKRQ